MTASDPINGYGLFLSAFVFLNWWLAILLWWLVWRPSSSRWVALTLGFNLTSAGIVLFFMGIRILGGSSSLAIISVIGAPVLAELLWIIRKTWTRILWRPLSRDAVKGFATFIGLTGLYFIVLSHLLLKNGFDGDGNLRLFGEFKTEVLQHVSMSQSLNHFIVPHSLQSFANPLGFYHFFPNVFLHVIMETSGGTHPVVVYNFFTAILLFGISLNVFTLTFLLWNRQKTALIAVALSLFCYDISSLVLWIRGLWRDHTLFFGAFEPEMLSAWTPILTQFQLLTNPSYLFSSVHLLGCIILTHEWKKSGGRWMMLVTAVSWAFLLKAKVTAFLMGIAGLFVWSIAGVLTRRDLGGLRLTGLVLLLTAPVFWMSLGHSKNSAEFSNWYFPANFALRANWIDARTHEEILSQGYPSNGNSLFKLLGAAACYYAGLVGFRWIVLLRRKPLQHIVLHLSRQSVHALAVCIALAGMAAFVLIANGVARYDSMWFYLTGLFILNTFAAERIEHVFKAAHGIATWPVRIITGILVVFSFLSFFIPAIAARWRDPVTINQPTVDALQFIKALPGNLVIATHYYHIDPSRKEDESSLITALTGKRVVCEGIQQDHHFRSGDPDFRTRVSEVRNDMDSLFFTKNRETALRITDDYHIDLIYLQNNDSVTSLRTMNFPVLFQNSEITIFNVSQSVDKPL